MDNLSMNQNQEKISPMHIFLHLFVIIMLYAATINFLTLIFQYINVWIADPLAEANYYSPARYFDIIRFALASFIVVFPVFILGSWFLNKSYLKNPAVRNMKTRKWLIYFTLFVASIVIVVDLVRIVFVFLEGEITLRFILKAFSVLVVTAVIFAYYLRDIKRERPSPFRKYFIWGIIIISIITIISGFIIIGSPQKERLRRFDQDRISDLQNIQREIINYCRSKEKLPEQLTDLEDEISGFKVPNDPDTNQPPYEYEYHVKGPESFELCAVFNLPGAADSYYLEGPSKTEAWDHEAGRNCFERTIDKELYPPYPVKPKD